MLRRLILKILLCVVNHLSYIASDSDHRVFLMFQHCERDNSFSFDDYVDFLGFVFLHDIIVSAAVLDVGEFIDSYKLFNNEEYILQYKTSSISLWILILCNNLGKCIY
jgi:hypothetical protein